MLIAATPPSSGGVATAPPPEKPSSREITLAGQIDLPRLIDVTAQRLKVNVEYDANALKGAAPVTLRVEGQLTDDELWLLLNRTLAARGYTTSRHIAGDGYSIVKLTEIAGVPRRLGTDDVGPPAGFKSVVVRAQHKSAKEIADALDKMLSKPAGSATPLGDSGLLLISDLAPATDQVLDLLPKLDIPGPSSAVEEIRLQNYSAGQLTAVFGQLLAKREAIRAERVPGDIVSSPDGHAVFLVCPKEHLEFWRNEISKLDSRDQTETATYSPVYFPAADVARLIEQTVKGANDDRWKLVVDELTGSLVVTGRPIQHEQIKTLLDRLDTAPTAARRPVRTFLVKNRSVRELQEILEDLLRAGVIDAGADQRALPQADATRGTDIIALPPQPTATKPGQNPLTPNDTGRDRGSADRGASRPMSARPQPAASPSDSPLVLTCDEGTNTLIAVGEPRLLSQVESLLKTLDVRQPQVMLEVLMVTLTEGQTLDLGVEIERITSAGDAQIRLSSLFGLGVRGPGGDRTAGDASGFTGVVLSPGEFSVIVRALQTLNSGRSVSMPKLLVGNNQSANLDSVVQQPYASVNASTTVSTTSFGGTQDAGTTVTIKPQIAEGDHLLLDYSVSLSAFLGSASNPNLPPPKQQNSVTSVATIPDGYTVVVGGIDLDNQSKTTSQVPLLGDIPILGEAFKTRNRINNSSKFYVFIRANILRNRSFEDLKYISDGAIAKARADDRWPEVKPRIIR